MFTGLVEELGAIKAVTREQNGYQLVIGANTVLEGVAHHRQWVGR